MSGPYNPQGDYRTPTGRPSEQPVQGSQPYDPAGNPTALDPSKPQQLDAAGKPFRPQPEAVGDAQGPLSPEEHQTFFADMLDRMHRVLAGMAATSPSLAGFAGSLNHMRASLDGYRDRMFPRDPALAETQQKAIDEAEINRLAAAKVSAARAAMSAAPAAGLPPRPATPETIDEALKQHSDTTLAGAAAAHDTAVAAAENDAKARDAAIADAKAATDRQAELDKAATERAREVLMASVVPQGPAPVGMDTAAGLREIPPQPGEAQRQADMASAERDRSVVDPVA